MCQEGAVVTDLLERNHEFGVENYEVERNNIPDKSKLHPNTGVALDSHVPTESLTCKNQFKKVNFS